MNEMMNFSFMEVITKKMIETFIYSFIFSFTMRTNRKQSFKIVVYKESKSKSFGIYDLDEWSLDEVVKELQQCVERFEVV